ncbi:MAG: signal recognition particle-docking protein FtsY [Candidatus Micrarchaeia archaeon]
MFDELRKKISNAVKTFVKKEEPEIKHIENQPSERENLQPEESAKDKQSSVVIGENKLDENGISEEKKGNDEVKNPNQTKDKEKPKVVEVGISTKIKGAILGSVRLSDSEIEEFVASMETSMLEADVAYEVAEHIGSQLKEELSQKKFGSKNLQAEVLESVRDTLTRSLSEVKGLEIPDFVSERLSNGIKPVKILFLGPNGTGKTTTIAKIAYMLKNNGKNVVMAASDTFRAAAIEQTEYHANKLGVPVIKSTYGADPASIAFDAIAYASSHGADVVLIDSAGRQETNKSLLREVEKMVRVAKPDLVIYVGESISGNAIASQINEFKKFIKIDGIILTKLDCDAKGGGAVSITRLTGLPVLYFGTGESYESLVKYSPQFIVNAIMP